MTNTFEARRQWMLKAIDSVTQGDLASPRPCPDLQMHLAECWNACEFALNDSDLANVWLDVDGIYYAHLDLDDNSPQRRPYA